MARISSVSLKGETAFKQAIRLLQSLSTKSVEDDFLLRLRQVNPGMLHRGNVYAFDYAIQRLPSKAPILEIGSFCGLSTNVITYYKRQHGVINPLISCDRWDYSFKGLDGSPIGKSVVSGAEWGKFVKATFLKNVSFFSGTDLPHALELFSTEFFQRWASGETVLDLFGRKVTLGGKLSFCYIDGNHAYDEVKHDFERCDKYLDPGGFILLDDSADFTGSPGVVHLIRELRKSRFREDYEVILKNPNYLVRKR